jgi:hypothetical protein|tara:strand:- start:1265 stop:2011 length:747 start_codon:yes stop_codon:yes gene_type:complete
MLIPLFNYEAYRIIMESSFVFKGKDYLYFPEGCNFYTLYRTTRKINTFSELEYIAEKFIHLNSDFDVDKMKMLFNGLSDRGSGHIIRTYSQNRVEDMIDRVHSRRKLPYCARKRKIVFNPSKMMDRKTKMKIVGVVIGRRNRPSIDDINSAIEELWLDKDKITISKVASKLNKTRHLVRWYFDQDKLDQFKVLNLEIKEENEMAKAIEAIDNLIEGGNKLKMRSLKQITSIRDYSLLKRAVNRYREKI